MNLRESIRRIIKEQLSPSVKRRMDVVNFDELIHEAKRFLFNPNMSVENNVLKTITKVAAETFPSEEHFQSEEENEQAWVEFTNFLHKKYSEELTKYFTKKDEDYKNKVKDPFVYTFLKHDEDDSGFSKTFEDMDLLIAKYGLWLPKLDWDLVKDNVDKIEYFPNNNFTGTYSSNRMLISKAGDDGNQWGYNFSIIKSVPKEYLDMNTMKLKKNLQESIRIILREVRVPRNERVELYKDKNIIVVVPLTHRALQKYAHQCQWCINDDESEWEDYHKGRHAVIIQRNPNKPKIGIKYPIPSEIFTIEHYSDIDSLYNIMGVKFSSNEERDDYMDSVTSSIDNFATNIVYYSPSGSLYDQEDNYLPQYGYEISDIPNVTPEVIKIMDDYLQKPEEMNLYESKKDVIKSLIDQSGINVASKIMGGIGNVIKILYDGDIREFSKDTDTPLVYRSKDRLNLYLHDALVDKLGLKSIKDNLLSEKELGDFRYGSKNGLLYKFTARLYPIMVNEQPYYKVVGTSGDSGFGYFFITKRNTLGVRYREQIFKQIIEKYGLDSYMN